MALSAAEAYVTGLAPYLQLALQSRLRQQELGLQGQQIAQTGQFQRGELANTAQQIAQQGAYQQGSLGVAQQSAKTQAMDLLTRAAAADPFNITGVMSKAQDYVRSLGLDPQQVQQEAAGQGAASPDMAPGAGYSAGQTQMPPQAGAAPQPALAPTSAPQTGAPQMGGIGQALQAGVTGPDLYQYMPVALRGLVKGLVDGTVSQAQLSRMGNMKTQLYMLASAVDPNFDATLYGVRQSVARGFTSGAQGNAIKSINQTMSHASKLLDNINQLNNSSFIPSLTNPVENFIGEHVLGQAAQGNFEQTAGALAAEMRKVFAAAGGGSLTELNKWEESLPLNGSPFQQRSYLKNGMDLLQGAISALQDQYRRGFGANANVEKLLAPQARAALERIHTMDPRTGQSLAGQPQAGSGIKFLGFEGQ